MVIRLDQPLTPVEKLSKRKKNRERLTRSEKKKFRRFVRYLCDASGEHNTKRHVFDIHHAFPVAQGGRKSYENLYYLTQEDHRAIHSFANYEHKKNGGDLGEITYKVTVDYVVLCKMGRFLDSDRTQETAEEIYARELRIDSKRAVAHEMGLRQLELQFKGSAEG
jgi:hypothetical protein